MSWGLSILAGVLTAAAGALAVGFLAERHTDWHAMSSFEGSSGYFVVFMGLLGIAIGFATGVTVSRFQPSFGLALATSAGGLVVICLALAAISRVTGEVSPEYEGSRLNLLLEIRGAVNWAPDHATEAGRGYYELIPRGGRSATGTFAPWEQRSRTEKDPADGKPRWILMGRGQLHTSSSHKSIAVVLGKTKLEFPLPLDSRVQAAMLDWSNWAGIPASPGFAYRYKLQKTGDTWAEDNEIQARMEKSRKAEVEKLKAAGTSTPAADWVRAMYERQDSAAEVAREELSRRVEELTPLLDANAGFEQIAMAVQAYRRVAAGKSPTPSPALAEAILRTGDSIEREIRDLTAAAANDPSDPDLKREKRVQLTFRAWQECLVRTPESAPRIKASMERILAAVEGARLQGDLNDIRHSARYDLESH